MVAALVTTMSSRGWRGPVSKLDISGDWGVKCRRQIASDVLAVAHAVVVLETSRPLGAGGFQPGRELGGPLAKDRRPGDSRSTAQMGKGRKPDCARQTGRPAVSQVLSARRRDLCRSLSRMAIVAGHVSLRQLPEVSGAMVARIPGPGRVCDGRGFSLTQSQFNAPPRTNGKPGSSFKPIVIPRRSTTATRPRRRGRCADWKSIRGQGGGVCVRTLLAGQFRGDHDRNALRL